MKKARYTLVVHHYIGYGAYNIEVLREELTLMELGLKKKTCPELHFIIVGWPEVRLPDGQVIYAKETKRATRVRKAS